MQAYGGFYLCFGSRVRAKQCYEKVLATIREQLADRHALDVSLGFMSTEEAERHISWETGLVRRGSYLIVDGLSELDAIAFAPEQTESGGNLFQAICRAIAENSDFPFEGRCGYTESGSGLQLAVCASCDGEDLDFRVAEAHSVMLLDLRRGNGAGLRASMVRNHGRGSEHLAALDGNELLESDPRRMKPHQTSGMHVYDQRWIPNPEWPYGGWMPYIRYEEAWPTDAHDEG